MSSSLCRSAWDSSKSKFLMSVAAAVMLAGCSADADRFTSAGADPVTTASVPNRLTAANVGLEDQVTSKQIATAPGQPPNYDYAKSYQAPAYRQPAAPAQAEFASVPEAPPGRTVTVGPGMTLYSIARANNVSVSELAAANGIQPPYSVRTGQALRIPGAGGAAGGNMAATGNFAEPEGTPIVEPKPGTPAAAKLAPFKRGPSVADDGSGATHTVASGETLFSLGRKYGISPFAIADANGLPNDAQLAMGQRVRIPAGGATRTAKAPEPKLDTAEVADAPEEADTAAAPQKTFKPMPEPEETEAAAPAETQQQAAEQAPVAGAPVGMRWPVRGKVISGFGPKANGLKNEGINIAVPEGTSIRAAESGVVAYAGNELKGYGNLVLIRHDNGYVTAYAHAKELFVKRGDTVKRGDVIAKAGQTGSVSSPQLHFEVRKGATALDPMKFLSSSTASN
jgi:murein DD-endopeptidase MepM/ murein hydrolase activator NlpD